MCDKNDEIWGFMYCIKVLIYNMWDFNYIWDELGIILRML